MIKRGRLETIHDKFIEDVVKHGGIVTYDNIKYLIEEYRKNEMDFHLVISGQNGTGKSITGITLAKYIDPNFDVKKNIVYAFNDVLELIDKLSTLKNSIIMVDEANLFFNYKKHMTKENIALINAIEITRANRNVVISCVRDVRKLDLNYRNGKAMMVIQLLDKGVRSGVPFGVVLQGNLFFEHEDKFLVDSIPAFDTIEQTAKYIEKLPTFRGYFQAKNYKDMGLEEVVKKYKEYKEQQMSTGIEKYKLGVLEKKESKKKRKKRKNKKKEEESLFEINI